MGGGGVEMGEGDVEEVKNNESEYKLTFRLKREGE